MKHFQHLFSRTSILTLFISISTSCFSQKNNPNLFEKVDPLFEEWNTPNSPGCAVGVIKDDQILFAKGYGIANLENQIPITPETSFHIASNSKQFTAACLAILILQKKISLEDDIRKYITDFPKFKDTIRVKHLIYHTNGLKDYPELLSYTNSSLEDFNSVKKVYDLTYSLNELVFEPGEKFNYGNHGYALAVKIIENVSKLTFKEFTKKHIIDPLDMKNTIFSDNSREPTINKAISYDKNYKGKWQKHYIHTPCIGTGNVITTLNDLMKWELNYHKNQVFPKGYKSLIEKTGILNNGDTIDYAFGVAKGMYLNRKTISHSGSVNSYESRIFRMPEYNLSVVILSNTYYMKGLLDNNQLAEKVAHLFLQEELDNRKINIRKTNVNDYPEVEVKTNFSGFYKSEKGLTHIFLKDNKYRIVHSFNNWFDSMLPINNNECIDEYETEEKYSFETDHNNRVITMNSSYTGRAQKTDNLFTPFSLKAYVGDFYSKELNCVYKFYTANQKLLCKIGNNPAIELFFISNKVLKLENLKIEPLNEVSGMIDSIKVSGSMGGNIKLNRIK